MSVMTHIKRVLGIGTRVQPIRMSDVSAPEMDAEYLRRSKEAVFATRTEVAKARLSSAELRHELAKNTLNLVVERRP